MSRCVKTAVFHVEQCGIPWQCSTWNSADSVARLCRDSAWARPCRSAYLATGCDWLRLAGNRLRPAATGWQPTATGCDRLRPAATRLVERTKREKDLER